MAVLVDTFLCRTDNYGYLVHDVETRKTAAIDAPITATGWASCRSLDSKPRPRRIRVPIVAK